MAYKAEYRRESVVIDEVIIDRSEAEAKEIAKVGMAQRRANFCRLLDLNGGEIELESWRDDSLLG